MQIKFLLALMVLLVSPSEVRSQSNQTSTVELNHVYVVLDTQTFHGLLASEFLQQSFAATDTGLPDFKKPEATSQSLYVRGKNTYLELLGPDNKFKQPQGKIGIAFSVEAAGALSHIEAELEAQKMKPARFTQQWTGGPKSVDWFDAVYTTKSSESNLTWWISETSPKFLAALYPDRLNLHGKIERKSFLESVYQPQKLLRDINSITLRMPSGKLQAFTESMKVLGYQVARYNNRIQLHGSSLTLNLKDAGEERSVSLQSIGFAANPSVSNRITEVISPEFAVHIDAGGQGQIAFGPTKGIVRHPDSVRREDCFAIESLPKELQKLSKKILLDALDSEALYTIVGGIKPVSEGFHSFFIEATEPDGDELARIERAMTAWQCGGCFEAGILPFDHLFDGKRYVSAWIAKRSSLAGAVRNEEAWFTKMGLTENTSAQAALLAIERSSSREDRWRGFGLLFGYPKDAIDFFVLAGTHQATTGEFVERDFRNFPTHDRKTGGFVYAVPKLSPESESELAVREKVESILAEYRAHRKLKIVKDDAEQVVELIRDLLTMERAGVTQAMQCRRLSNQN
jgi:hypothetical protein